MSHRKMQKERARLAKLREEQGRKQRRYKFWRIPLLVGGIVLLAGVGYLALREPAKKIESDSFKPMTEEIQKQNEVSERGMIVRKARKLVMSVPFNNGDLQAAYKAALDAINSSGVVAQATNGRVAAILNYTGYPAKGRPDLEYFMGENGDQGNLITIRFDPRLMALLQFLDVASGGNPQHLDFSWNTLMMVNSLLLESHNQNVTGNPHLYQSYSTEEAYDRDDVECVDMAIIMASLAYLAEGFRAPRLAEIMPFLVENAPGGTNWLAPDLGHIVVVCPTVGDSIEIVDPLFAQAFGSVFSYINGSRLKDEFVTPALDSLRRANPSTRVNPTMGFFGMCLAPTRSEISPKMAKLLSQNSDSAAFVDVGGGSGFLQARRNAFNSLIEKGVNPDKILMQAGYVEGQYKR